jgi:hypothetical protein
MLPVWDHADAQRKPYLRALQQREQEDQARLDWLRGAAREGFDAIEQSNYVTLRSGRDVEAFVRQASKEASVQPRAGRA